MESYEPKSYPVYKGLQKPLVYKGFKGRYMYWAIGSVVGGVVLGGLTSVLINLYVAVIVMAAVFAGGIWITSQKQKDGLHDKTKANGVYVFKPNLRGTRNVKSKSI